MNTTPVNTVRRSVRPFSPTNTRRVLKTVSTFGKGGVDESLRVEMIVALVTLTGRDDEKRHALTRFLFGKESTKELTGGEAGAIVSWCKPRKEGDRWVVCESATREAKKILRAVKRQQRAS